MKLHSIKPILSLFTATQVLESAAPQAKDLILESAAEMVRILRTTYHDGVSTEESLGQLWTAEHIAKFLAALEKIERIVSDQIAKSTLQPNLRDVVFSVLTTSDFDHATAIEKIVKQSHDQQERIAFWQELIAAGDVQKLGVELDRVGRDVSALVGLMRTKGAQAMPQAKVEPTVKAENPTL